MYILYTLLLCSSNLYPFASTSWDPKCTTLFCKWSQLSIELWAGVTGKVVSGSQLHVRQVETSLRKSILTISHNNLQAIHTVLCFKPHRLVMFHV